ncbi:MAG: 50S ribosomal protein L21, partial [Gemmatimonadota bacterium]|nr:50S ribosomal protein L21 [Gemmatimonadota bacterium]
GNAVKTGAPTIKGAKVVGEIVRHGRGDKIIVFKFKRRKNYARKQGHRQGFTEVRINDISLG